MVPGSTHALGRRRVRLAPDISKIPPACGRIFFQLSPRGRVLVHPRAGALPETMALSRLWRGGDERLGWRGSGFTGRIRDPTAVGITGCLLEVFLRAGFGIYSSLALCPAARLAVGWAVRGSMNLLRVKNANCFTAKYPQKDLRRHLNAENSGCTRQRNTKGEHRSAPLCDFK